jgi:hypothetical protein
MGRWYERERWPYTADRQTANQYAKWLMSVPWKFFATFTFAWKVSDPQAAKIFDAFINRLEKYLQCDVTYVRGDEKRISGCGKPESGRHFHVLLTCVAPIDPRWVEELWMSMAGERSDGAGAQVKPYDGSRNGASYVMKLINQVEGDWKFRKLHLFHRLLMSEGTLNRRQRRNVRRHETRQQFFERPGCN